MHNTQLVIALVRGLGKPQRHVVCPNASP
ncbi:hypothetical protein LCGC14_3103190, partial [marine sediment metagenome]